MGQVKKKIEIEGVVVCANVQCVAPATPEVEDKEWTAKRLCARPETEVVSRDIDSLLLYSQSRM